MKLSTLSGFDDWYKNYPKKKSRGSAEKAWKALKPSPGLQLLMKKGLEQARMSSDWTKDGGQYIPHPATWIRARGWEDDFTPVADVINQPRQFMPQQDAPGEKALPGESTAVMNISMKVTMRSKSKAWGAMKMRELKQLFPGNDDGFEELAKGFE